jgi:hypothetical protein
MATKKYGNDDYWSFFEDGWDNREVAIWKKIENIHKPEEIVARAIDKYEAKIIIDALLKYANTKDGSNLTKKETVFLQFVCSNCIEPYVTMASNALLWQDKRVYQELKHKFPTIY